MDLGVAGCPAHALGTGVGQMKENATYRLALAHGFLREAQEDLSLQRWRSAVDNEMFAIAQDILNRVDLLVAEVNRE